MRNVPLVIVNIRPEGHPKFPLDFGDKILAMKYEDHDSKIDKLVLTVENDDLRNFDEPMWRTGNEIYIRWGYPEAMTVERVMTIRKVTGFRELSVEAYGKGLALDRIEEVRTYENVRRSDVARGIATKWGYTDTRVVHIEDTKVVKRVIHQAAVSDAVLLRQMANAEGFKWYMDHDGFHFHKPNFLQPERTIKVLTYYSDQAHTEILDINIENDVTRNAGSVTFVGRDPKNGLGIKIDATEYTDKDKQVLAQRRETAGLQDIDIPGLENIAHHSIKRTSDSDLEAVRRSAEAALQRSRHIAVKMRIKTVGDPNILAKSIVFVENIGKRLSQRYYIKGVTHEISSEYTCDIECISDGSGGHRIDSLLAPEARAIEVRPATGGKHAPSNGGGGLKDANGNIIGAPAVAAPPPAVNPQPVPQGTDEGTPVVDDVTPGNLAAKEPTPENPYAKAIKPGNLDLATRPHVRRDNGDISTTDSHTVPRDGVWYLVPGVTDDGRILQTDDDAYSYYEQTGKHLGVYKTQADADQAGEMVHLQQMKSPPVDSLGARPSDPYNPRIDSYLRSAGL